MLSKSVVAVLAIIGLVSSGCGDDDATPGTTSSSSSSGTTSSSSCSGSFTAGAQGGSVHIDADVPDAPAGDYVVTGKGTCGGCGLGLQRNDDEYFLNFAGPGPTGTELSLRFGGINRVGTFKCGEQAKPNDSYAAPTDLQFWVAASGLSIYRKDNTADATCSVTISRLDAAGVEGCYTATLYANGKKATISGNFRDNR